MAHQRAANRGKELPVVSGISASVGYQRQWDISVSGISAEIDGSPPKSMEAQGAVLCLLPFPSVIGHHSG